MIDFAQLKQEVSIERAIGMLGLKLNKEGDKLRGLCPACNAGSDRAIVVTPEKNVFFCFSQKKGGDVLNLVAHIKQCSIKEAAEFIKEKMEAPAPAAKKTNDTHEGFPKAICKPGGIKYAKEAELTNLEGVVWKKPVRIPVRDDTGKEIYHFFVDCARLPKKD